MNKIIIQSARLHCSVERAFAMFTRDEQLERWLTRLANVEPVVGGAYELYWNPDSLIHQGTRGCKITALEPGALLAFEWKGPEHFSFMNEIDPLTHVSVFFALCDEVLTPCTDVYLLHTGWRADPEWERARLYFTREWENALAALETVING